MNGNNALLDSNIIIYLSKRKVTAKALNLCLVTRNIHDFEKVEIQIANPFD